MASNATNGGMSPHDVELCRGFSKTLQSEKNRKYSNMFQYPFDLNQVPGYLDVCPKAMDLTTLSHNLDDGRYSTREEFLDDCFMIFENAIKYHSDKDQTKWLVPPAQQMLKLAKREQVKLEKKLATGGTVGAAPKLKLKLGGAPSAALLTAGADTVTKPKIKIKPSSIAVASHGKTPPAGVNLSSTPLEEANQPPPNKKPRLTLKLGKPKVEIMVSPSIAPAPLVPKTTPKSTTSSGSGSSSKMSIKVSGGASRGKELPKGVAPPEPSNTSDVSNETKKATATKKAAPAAPKKTTPIATIAKAPGKAAATKTVAGKGAPVAKLPAPKGIVVKKDNPMSKTKIFLKQKTMGSTASTSSKEKMTGTLPMTPTRSAQCSKVLNGLKRRQAKNIIWFEKPVSDKKIIQDYRAKIRHPMDLSAMQNKLDRGVYTSVAAFALDIRRIFGNCLQYNTSIVKDSLRPVAVETAETAEQLMSYFLGKPEMPQQAYPPLLFCWKLCLSVLDTLYNLTNPDDKMPTAYFFLYPVSFYFQGHLPLDYLEKAPRPMDFGTITGKLVEGQYTSVEQFEADCRLVIQNCMAYNGSKPENKAFCQQAGRLNDVLQQQLEALNRYIKSPAGLAAKRVAELSISTSSLPKPPIPLLSSVVEELRDEKYTDKQTKIAEPVMSPFEKPVSVAEYPDYMKIVQFPMDLQTIDRKTKAYQYSTPEDFEYDMVLMFQNCINYNNFRKIDHLVSMGRFGLSKFRKIFPAKMKFFDDPSSVSMPLSTSMDSSTTATRKDPPLGAAEQGPSKKVKIESNVCRGKTAPRISLNAAALSEAQKALQNQGRKSPKLPPVTPPKPKSNQPVPLHIAIAQVKERFPLRRAVNSLQSWEAACTRFFKELMRHPWISAARPKFIFHVPVPVLFPALSEAYAAKITKPMDLTTVECTLLAGNRYATPEDFVNDVALVFANAILFNKDGRDIGDPLSCAYYDASIHLLKYSRWLSLELLSEYELDSDHVDEPPEEDGMPLTSWKLTAGNKKQARNEMEAIVLKEPIEKSLEGDRYTWTEAECEKLLKALRHQSDLKYMTFFITPNYPPDYTAFISRPMDWERVQRTLKKRQYGKFGDIIDDLRLIFSNALKYNCRHAGTDTVSGLAYDAAKFMSVKLEASINKLMLAVSDRVERERIDHSNAEREIAAAERAEEERIRAQWKSEVGKDADGGSAPLKVEATQRIRPNPRIILRKSDTDFEVPFFDEEDDGQHERSYFEVMKQQKATFETQRSELDRMRDAMGGIGQTVYGRIIQKELALKWVAEEQKKILAISPPRKADANGGHRSNLEDAAAARSAQASSVFAKLDAKDRNPVKMKWSKAVKVKAKNKKKRKAQPGDWDDEEEE